MPKPTATELLRRIDPQSDLEHSLSDVRQTAALMQSLADDPHGDVRDRAAAAQALAALTTVQILAVQTQALVGS